ncbi:MAG: site-specific integrase [Hyphomicrobiales bacterium]|nr:MAG: site-specific integrase [Hyphomicrobiales bacterium]
MLDNLATSVTADQVRPHDLTHAVVSEVIDDHGHKHVLSRFDDARWDLTPYFEQSNVPESMKTIVWPLDVTPSLLRDAKAALFQWFKEGRPGYKAAISRTIFIAAVSAGPLLRWLSKHGVGSFHEIKPLHLSTYRQLCREEGLRPRGIKARLEIVDLAWVFRDHLHQPPSQYPWGEISFASYSGGMRHEVRSSAGLGVGKTPVIPREVQSALFLHCERIFNQAKNLFGQRDAGTLGPSTEPMRALRDSCLYLLSITSGMRNDEVIGIEVGAGRRELRDGVEFCWVASVEHKTGKGRVEYMVPPMTLKVVEVLERYSEPLRAALKEEIQALEASIAQMDVAAGRRDLVKRLNQARGDVQRVFLGVISGKHNQITALSGVASRVAMLRLASKAGQEWKLSPHQCRRTYARTVVESRMGRQALVFLKWQFKHSSISMSQLYAANPAQDPALYEDILAEYFDIKKDLLESWSDPDQRLSGGAGRKILEMRASAVPDRERLVANTAIQINIRATGHGWCIAQDSGCGGAGLYENTRCVDCKNSVIDEEYMAVWQGIHEQHREMLDLDDLGPVANERIRRDLALSAKVLADFGVIANGGTADPIN